MCFFHTKIDIIEVSMCRYCDSEWCNKATDRYYKEYRKFGIILKLDYIFVNNIFKKTFKDLINKKLTYKEKMVLSQQECIFHVKDLSDKIEEIANDAVNQMPIKL